MKKVIGGKRYDTDTAKEVAYFEADYLPSDLDWWQETLYRKNTGEFFLYGEGNARTQYAKEAGINNWRAGSRIIPLSVDEAKAWAEKYLSADEYEKIFGEIDESAEKKTVSFSLSETVIEQISRLAAEYKVSKSEVIEMLVKERK